MKSTAVATLILLSSLALPAAVPLRWTVETSRLQPVVFDVVRGETLALEASFQSYGTPLAMTNHPAGMFLQTNGMASSWWTYPASAKEGAPSVLKATFAPSMDPGAGTLTGFIGSTGEIYRAAFTLRFRNGPGRTPNALPLPTPVIDCEKVTFLNPESAPFSGGGGTDTNAVKALIESETRGTNTLLHTDFPMSEAWTNGVAAVVTNDVGGFTPWTTGDVVSNDYIVVTNMGVSIRRDDYPPYRYGWYMKVEGTDPNGRVDSWIECTYGHYDMNATMVYPEAFYWLTSTRTAIPPRNALGLAYARDVPSTNGFVTAAVTNVVAAEVRTKASASDVSTLNTGYTRLYNFVSGATNANFTATNYPPNAAAAAAKYRWQPEAGMDFSDVPASLQLNERRDGAWRKVMDTRDWTAWYFRFKERALTNEIAKLKAENAALSNRLVTAQAWGNFTANGVENPMTDTTVVDRPNMWLMAGYEWQKCVSGTNSCWVIRAKNMALSGGANTNGFLEICDAFGQPYMRVNKSADTLADVVFSNITYNVSEGAWYVVYGNQSKPTKGGANCELVGANSGGGRCILYDEDDPDCPATITWPETAESHAGHWIMKAVPKPVNGVVPTKMFFGAEIHVAGSDYVEYVKEASFGAGIRVGNNVYEAVESGNTLIWQKKEN